MWLYDANEGEGIVNIDFHYMSVLRRLKRYEY